MGFGMAHQREPDLEGEVSPLVEVHRQRVRLLHARDRRTERRRQRRERAEGPVHVEPEPLLPAERGEPPEVVGRAGVHRAGVPDDADRPVSRRAIGRDQLAERADLHPVLGIHRRAAEGAVAQAQQLAGLPGPAVGLARAVHQQARSAGALQPLRADVEAGPVVPGHRQAHKVRDGGAAHQQAARAGREAQQLGHPADHLPLHQGRGLIVAGEVRVHPRGQHVGEHREGGPRAHHPAPEAGVDVAGGIGEDVLAELAVHGRRIGGAAGHGLVQGGAGLGGHGAPYRALAHALEIVQHVVHHAVAERAELAPVGRVEALLDPPLLTRHRSPAGSPFASR